MRTGEPFMSTLPSSSTNAGGEELPSNFQKCAIICCVVSDGAVLALFASTCLGADESDNGPDLNEDAMIDDRGDLPIDLWQC